MGIRKLIVLSIGLILSLADCLMPIRVFGQEECKPDGPGDLKAFYDTAKVYPSLTPRSYIKVGYAPYTDFPYAMSPERIDTYLLKKEGDSTDSVHPERVDVTIAPGVAYLFLKPQTVGNGDKIKVGIRLRKSTPDGASRCVEIWQEDLVTIEMVDPYTFRLKPGFVPDQELRNGKEKAVGNVEVGLDVPSLIPNEKIARFYLKSENFFTTDSRVKTSKMQFKTGAERSLIDSWFIPFHIEGEVNGDQALRNASFILSGGMRTLIPWRWTRRLLFESRWIKAPFSPEFELNAQYDRRLRQEKEAKMRHPDEDTFRLFGQMAWNPVHVFTGGNYSPYDPSLEILVKGWWFPEEKTNAGTRAREFEGQLALSFLVPLMRFPLADGVFFQKPPDGANPWLRVRYTYGANEAKGFARSSELTVGIEVLR